MLILETKSESKDIYNQKWVNELLDNIHKANTKHQKVVGVLYNSKKQRVFINDEEYTDDSKVLHHKNFYINLFLNKEIDTQ